jgi:hypothetical protein
LQRRIKVLGPGDEPQNSALCDDPLLHTLCHRAIIRLMITKEEAARKLIEWHFRVEPEIVEIYRFRSSKEEEPDEPIKLLEVNAATIATGRVQPFGFTGDEEIPFPSVVAEVTPAEMDRIRLGELAMPKGWNIDDAEKHPRPRMSDAAE